MALRTTKTNKSVTFTQEEADQTLLEAIEQELANEQYKTFSDLCKQALKQFFSVANHQPDDRFTQLEQQIIRLQIKFTDFEQSVLTQESRRFHQLESQLIQLTQQLQQMQDKINPQTTPEPEVVSPIPAPERELDPLLSRLSPMFEDF